MRESRTLNVSRRLYYGFTALCLWVAVLLGIFFALEGKTATAIIAGLAGALVLFALLQPRLRAWALQRKIPQLNLLVFLAVLILVGFSEIRSLLTSPVNSSTDVLATIYSGGYLLIAGFILGEVMRLMRGETAGEG